jgi:hypothetical protein
VNLNGLLIPRRVRVLRNQNIAYEADAVGVECNPPLNTSFFLPKYASV